MLIEYRIKYTDMLSKVLNVSFCKNMDVLHFLLFYCVGNFLAYFI